MHLRYSAADEVFRDELREWFAHAIPACAPSRPPGDWAGRRSYDTGWQRTLHGAAYAGLDWPVEYGGPASQQLEYLEEYAPYVGIDFVGTAHAGPTLMAAGTSQIRHNVRAERILGMPKGA